MNKVINIEVVKKVARALQELREQVVFVGGAVVSLYADDPAAEEVRPTFDIDITINLRSYGDWARTQERLAQLGFYPAATEKLICRYMYENIQVDIMPAEDSAIGPTNPWYKPGLKHARKVNLEKDHEILILPLAYFIATKFSAFHNRGGDYRISHDFEDIIYVTDNSLQFTSEISNSEKSVQDYLKEQYRLVYDNKYREEIISAQLSSFSKDRLPLILEKIHTII